MKKKTGILPIAAGVVLAALIFIHDLFLPLGVAGGVSYIVLVLVSVWTPKQRHTLMMAGTGTALTILGFYYSSPGGIMWMVMANRFFAIFAIWTTAILVLQKKRAEEKMQIVYGAMEKEVEQRTFDLRYEIDERVRAEEKLRMKTKELETIIHSSRDGIFTVDLETNALWWSDRLHEIIGTTPETLGGNRIRNTMLTWRYRPPATPWTGCQTSGTACRFGIRPGFN